MGANLDAEPDSVCGEEPNGIYRSPSRTIHLDDRWQSLVEFLRLTRRNLGECYPAAVRAGDSEIED